MYIPVGLGFMKIAIPEEGVAIKKRIRLSP
jgi:hypothetical protein